MDRGFASAVTLRLSPGPLIKVAIALCAILFPIKAYGQSPLDRIHDFLDSASGFNLLGDIQRGVLRTNEKMSIAVTLLEGADYMVVAYCDDTCGNLDLALFDERGNEVQADRLPDTEPFLALSAEKSGEFQIVVETGECPEDGCYVAVGILGSTEESGAVPGEDMGGRLAIFGMEVTRLGFTRSGEEPRGGLLNGEADKLPIPLQKGMEYRIAGTCDLDCYDLDLALFDPEGAEVATDFLDDDFPILVFVPETTGIFQLEVIMIACGLEPCGFRTASYAREVPVDPQGAYFSGDVVSYQTFNGELRKEDDQLSDTYFDEYEVEVEAGQRLLLDLRSEDFDTLLRLFPAEGQGEENDDFGTEIGHSRLEVLAVTNGKYTVQVASATSYSTGSYELQIAVLR